MNTNIPNTSLVNIDLQKFILICATGRSGSTTLQRLVHTIPNSNICGENYGAINDLLKFYNNIKKSCEDFIPGNYSPYDYNKLIEQNIKPAWYNSFNFNIIKNQLQQLIISMFKINNETKVIGFKELRWDLELLNTFLELFPNTKVLVHIKENTEEQSQSGWWKDDESSLKILKNQNKKYIHFYKKNKKFCYLSTFENMFQENKIIELFNFLEEEINLIEYQNIIKNNIKD
jgi:hypothetical protein